MSQNCISSKHTGDTIRNKFQISPFHLLLLRVDIGVGHCIGFGVAIDLGTIEDLVGQNLEIRTWPHSVFTPLC